MPSFAIYGLVALGLLAAGFTSGYRVESWHAAAQRQAAIDAAIAEYKGEAEKANAAAAALEQKKDASHVVYQTITRNVDRIVEKPVYRDRCLDDDGLRAANAALAGAAAAAAGADAALPGAHAAGGRDGGFGAAQAR